MERLGKLNSKRNTLVHGHWVLEANVILRRGDAVLVTQFLRELTPPDPKVAKAMANPRNQKERVRWSFNLKRIEAAARETDKLRTELWHFSEKMKLLSHHGSPAEVMQAIIESRPYPIVNVT